MPELNIRVRAGSDETKTQQIFNQIASAILAGKFTRGDAITSERALAEQLGVSRNIVRNAYQRLEEHGLIETFSTSGRRASFCDCPGWSAPSASSTGPRPSG